METVSIDCGTCAMRSEGCDECVVHLLLGHPDQPQAPDLSTEELQAVEVLWRAGMLAPPISAIP